jgi:predicted glycosyltransferase involved in capsule biosynthesis
MDKLITINLSYYNQDVKVLKEHINAWSNFDKPIRDRFSFFIMDDGSKIPVMQLLETIDYSKIDLHVYRVEVDLFCNIGGVRNLGARECKTPYMIICDMDTLICNNTANQMLELAEQNKTKNKAFIFNRKVINNTKHKKHNVPHPAVCLIRVIDYWTVGGCDEDLVGNYGMTDPSFWQRAKKKIEKQTCHTIYLIYMDDGEANIKRNSKPNEKLVRKKTEENSWSVDFVRFPWNKVL